MQIRYLCHHFGSAQKSLFRNIKNVFHSLEQPGVHLRKDDAPPHEASALLQSAVSLLTNCISHFIHSTKNFLLPPIERFTTSMTNLNLCNSYPISACADLWAGLWPLYCVRACMFGMFDEVRLTGSGLSLIHLVHQSWLMQLMSIQQHRWEESMSTSLPEPHESSWIFHKSRAIRDSETQMAYVHLFIHVYMSIFTSRYL